MTHKPVFISAMPESKNEHAALYVIRDDGTMWEMILNQETEKCIWKRIPDIPQAHNYEPAD